MFEARPGYYRVQALYDNETKPTLNDNPNGTAVQDGNTSIITFWY